MTLTRILQIILYCICIELIIGDRWHRNLIIYMIEIVSKNRVGLITQREYDDLTIWVMNKNIGISDYNNSIYCLIFWNIDDFFTYLGGVFLVAFKFAIIFFDSTFNFNLLSFFSSYSWYDKLLSGSPKSDVRDVFEFSVLNDLVAITKTIRSHLFVSMDVHPINGFLSPYLLEHPEVCVCMSKYEHNYFINTAGTLIMSYLNSRMYYVVDTALVLFANMSMLFIVWFYLKVFFFSHVFNFYADSGNNDTDYTVSVLITEAEKEIAGIDDLIIIFLVLFFVFGVYFLFYGFAQMSVYFNNYAVMYVILPILFFFIYMAPVCVLFDFGVYLFVYLRGSGPTAMLAAELLYDIINTFAYFIRVFIQLARILLMLIAAGSLQEFIFYIGIDYRFLMIQDSFLDTIYNIEFNVRSLSLFFFTKLPTFILYWIYEVFHTYFVVTIQTIAFFAMVFWLYFYLFTFFFSEAHENYFKVRRVFYKRLFKVVRSVEY